MGLARAGVIGRILEVRYTDSRVCDTWIGITVERLHPSWIVRVLVLHDPLDEFQGQPSVLAMELQLRQRTVKEYG